MGFSCIFFLLSCRIFKNGLFPFLRITRYSPTLYTPTGDMILFKYNVHRIHKIISSCETGDLQSHPCERPCEPNSPPMTCQYYFEIEKYLTRSKACYYCPFIFEDCFRPDCIPADGVRRLVTVINRQLPGPSINVKTRFVQALRET